jgi:hypothetical protein
MKYVTLHFIVSSNDSQSVRDQSKPVGCPITTVCYNPLLAVNEPQANVTHGDAKVRAARAIEKSVVRGAP